jgi:filamentous hemagglutinin
MLGENGAQFISKTVYQDETGHIDVENPAPGQRPGQIHFQDYQGNKYIYNPQANEFTNAPNSVNSALQKQSVQNAIQKR